MDFKGLFIKFGKEEHLLSLQKEGKIHCKTIQYFKEVEENNLRGDKYETVVNIENLKDLILEIKIPNDISSEFKKAGYVYTAQYLRSRTDDFGNLFCLYSFNVLEKENGEVFTIDIKNKEFGTHLLLITNPAEFISRLRNVILEKGYDYTYDYVEYLDFKNYNGKKTVFQKNISYNYQKEFRIFIDNNSNENIELVIGDISDISIMYSTTILDIAKFKIELFQCTI